MNTATAENSPSTSKGWNVGLWAAQIALAGMFGMAGYNKLFLAPDQLVEMGMKFVADVPIALVRFIGFAETAGTLGIILPAATRIMPKLTSLAALGFAAIQILAMLLHLSRGELMVLPVNLVLLALSVFVIWGRKNKAPISPRS